MLIGADTTSWYIGLGLGAVVVVVAVIIVGTILILANRIAGQAETASDAVETLRSETDGLSGVAKVNDSDHERFSSDSPRGDNSRARTIELRLC